MDLSYKEEKTIISYYYDKNWNAFKSFLRKRFAFSNSIIRKLYEASFSELIEKVRQGRFELENIPFKVELFRIGSQRAINLLEKQSKDIPEKTSAYLEEYAWQEQYIQIHRCVYRMICGKDSVIHELESSSMLACIKKLVSIQGVKETQWLEKPTEEISIRQDEMVAYFRDTLSVSERRKIEKKVKEDSVYAQQYDSTMLYLETETNILDELELVRIIKEAPKELFTFMIKEKQVNRRFIWQAAIVALILFLLNCLMKVIW